MDFKDFDKYENLDDDLLELNRNIMQLNDKKILKAQLKNDVPSKAEKKLKKTIDKLRKKRK